MLALTRRASLNTLGINHFSRSSIENHRADGLKVVSSTGLRPARRGRPMGIPNSALFPWESGWQEQQLQHWPSMSGQHAAFYPTANAVDYAPSVREIFVETDVDKVNSRSVLFFFRKNPGTPGKLFYHHRKQTPRSINNLAGLPLNSEPTLHISFLALYLR